MIDKRCSVCRALKPVNSFSISRAAKDGRANRCKKCNKAYMAAWREKNPDHFKNWAKENSDHRRAYFAEWQAAHQDRRAKYNADWTKKNKSSVNARVARRNALKFKATPSWADDRKIKEFYARADDMTKRTGVKHEVDHYYPLQGEIVCGLHCEYNLQILTKAENISKLNRMPEEWAAGRDVERVVL